MVNLGWNEEVEMDDTEDMLRAAFEAAGVPFPSGEFESEVTYTLDPPFRVGSFTFGEAPTPEQLKVLSRFFGLEIQGRRIDSRC